VHPTALDFRDLIRRLNIFGVEIAEDRGKGSEIILHAPDRKPGVIHTIKDKRQKGPYDIRVIGRILSKFDIPKSEFWLDLRALKRKEREIRKEGN